MYYIMSSLYPRGESEQSVIIIIVLRVFPNGIRVLASRVDDDVLATPRFV